MSRLEELKKAASLNDFAGLLHYKPKAVSYILYKIPVARKYKKFEIPKTNGEKRTIKAPTERLKHLQRRLANLLNECFELISKEKKSLSHGFRKRHSIITNAKNHKNKRNVFNIDLKDFFPSINFGRVRGYFIQNHHFKLNPKIATVIAQIACHDNELPQGSPCSPIISNLIGHLLDIRMAHLAKKTKCTYSRYADDLTFSTNKKEFPKIIAIQSDGNKWVAGEKLIKEIEKTGFIVNHDKTSMQFKTSRQMTTGLIVNEKVNVKREYYKKARAMCHSLFKTGTFYIDENVPIDDSENEEQQECPLNQLEGILNFIYQVKKKHDFPKHHKKKLASTKLYRNFLLYKHFFAMEKPLIICEGKTDIIYLKCALRQLASHYSEFVEINEGKVNFKTKFLTLSDNLINVFSTSQGSSGLFFLMENYKKNRAVFKYAGNCYPAIFIFDNDDGAKQIKNHFNIQEDATIETYYHYFENLYVLIVPKNKKGAIEDLFTQNTLDTKVDKKSLNCAGKIDTNTEHGKVVFAEKVVRANQQKINFDGFKEIFDGIKTIIKDYQKKKDTIKSSRGNK
ncbi:MAG: retron Ec67 family RNA-directed DNA polymerase/endonuclease [Candidatus Auribacterota bacterium]